MQNILPKRTLSLLSRSKPQLHPFFLTSLAVFPVSRPLNLSLTQTQSFCFSEDRNNKDFTPSYEHIVNAISNADNANQIIDNFFMHGSLYRNDQVVLSMRMLGRLIRTITKFDIFSKDERFIKLQERMKQGIDSYNDHELLDLLFWLRKFKAYRIPLAISDRDLSLIFVRINEFVKAKSYSCRNLINIYFDYSHMRQQTDLIAEEILNDLKTDTKILTTFSCIQIIQAVSDKDYLTHKDNLLLNHIIKSFSSFEQDFDIEQKSSIFKHLAKVELQYAPPRFYVPNLFYKLKDQLKEKIEHLSEIAVNNVITAYEFLPKEFPTDFLDEIKEMISVTLQHNPKNIKSLFLLDIYDTLSNLKLKRRRMNEQKLAIIEKEIISRIKDNDVDITKWRTLENILETFIKNNRVEGVTAIYEYVTQNSDETKMSIYMMESFARFKLDIRKYIDLEILKEENNFKLFNSIRLYNLLDFVKLEQYANVTKDLEAKLMPLIETDPVTFCKCFVGTEINYPLKGQILVKVVPELMKKFGDKRVPYRFFFRIMFETCINKNLRVLWTEFLNKNIEIFNREEYVRANLIEAMAMIAEPHTEAFNLFLSFLDQFKLKNNDVRRLVNGLKGSKGFFNVIERQDYFLTKLARILQRSVLEDPSVRLLSIYSFILKLSNYKPRNQMFLPVIEKYLLSDSSVELGIQMQASLFLLNRRALSQKAAETLVNKLTQQRAGAPENTIKIKLLNQSVIGETISEEKLAVLTKNYNQIKENLNNPSTRQVLSNLALIFTFPPEIIRDDTEFLKKTLEDFILQGNSSNFMSLLRGLIPAYIRKNNDIYWNFMKVLTNSFNSFVPKMAYMDILDCLSLFSDAGVRSPAVYNLIIENIGKNFGYTRMEDLITILRDFSHVGLKQIDLFEKVLQKFFEFNQSYARTNLVDVIQSLYIVGFDSDYIKKSLLPFIKSIDFLNSKNIRSLILFLNYLPILNCPEEHSLMEEYSAKLAEKITERHGNNFSMGSNVNFYITLQYMRLVNKSESVKQIMSVIDKNLPELEKRFEKRMSMNYRIKSRETVLDYLKVMKIETQVDFKVEGIIVDIFIPSQNIIIQIASLNETNYDRKSLRGQAIVLNKIYNSFTQYKTALIVYSEMLSNPDHLTKVQYLQDLGIKSPVTEDQYDFSHLKAMKQFKERKPKEVEAVLLSEDEVEEEEEPIKKVEELLEEADDLIEGAREKKN